MDEYQGKTAVSIIIPTYNRAGLIGRAVTSVLEQTFTDFEIIIVDDGSNDNTSEVVKSFNDPRIKYIKLDQNRGAAAARNVGIKEAKAGLIAFQDSDNEWYKEKLEKQVKEFEKVSAKTGVVYSGMWRIEENKKTYIPYNKIRGLKYKKEGNIHSELLIANFIDLSTAVVRRECFSKVGGFDEKLPCLQDWELWIRISKDYEFRYLKEALMNLYYSSDSISINPEKLATALKHILDKHFSEFSEYNKKTLSDHYLYLGNILCLQGDIVKGKECFRKAREVCVHRPVFLRDLMLLLTRYEMHRKLKRIF